MVENPALTDNWDDAEGYYSKLICIILLLSLRVTHIGKHDKDGSYSMWKLNTKTWLRCFSAKKEFKPGLFLSKNLNVIEHRRSVPILLSPLKQFVVTVAPAFQLSTLNASLLKRSKREFLVRFVFRNSYW